MLEVGGSTCSAGEIIAELRAVVSIYFINDEHPLEFRTVNEKVTIETKSISMFCTELSLIWPSILGLSTSGLFSLKCFPDTRFDPKEFALTTIPQALTPVNRAPSPSTAESTHIGIPTLRLSPIP
jgi:hypothetical protein